MSTKIDSIKVGARKYDIALVEQDSFLHELSSRGVTNDSVKSFIDYDDQLIVINDSLKEDHKRELLIHELLHACLEDTGSDIDPEIAEKLIACMSPRLNQLLDGQLIQILHRLFSKR